MKKSRDGKRDQHNLDCTTRKLCFDPIFIDFHHYLNIPKLPILSGFFCGNHEVLGLLFGANGPICTSAALSENGD